jgi:hypothetical protein
MPLWCEEEESINVGHVSTSGQPTTALVCVDVVPTGRQGSPLPVPRAARLTLSSVVRPMQSSEARQEGNRSRPNRAVLGAPLLRD